MYKSLVKPILFLFTPDFVHNSIVRCGRAIQVVGPVRWLLAKLWRRDHTMLGQNIHGIDFANPVGLSAGFDKNIELMPLMRSVGFGFETGGSVTLGARRGNPRPWFFRLPKTESIVVHAGLANKGMVNIRKSVTRGSRRAAGMPLFISVAVVAKTAKETYHDAIIDAKNTTLYILQRNLAQAVEVNISCPNAGDDQPFTHPELLEQLLGELDKLERSVPFFIKMPQVSSLKHLDGLLSVIAKHNIQGITVANLIKDRQSIELADELPGSVLGGLSGAPTRQRSTAMVHYAYKKYGHRLTIIGVGGVFTAEHAYEKIRAGASLVGLVTGMIFEGPGVVGQINQDLVELLKRDGFNSLTEAIGADHRN